MVKKIMKEKDVKCLKDGMKEAGSFKKLLLTCSIGTILISFVIVLGVLITGFISGKSLKKKVKRATPKEKLLAIGRILTNLFGGIFSVIYKTLVILFNL